MNSRLQELIDKGYSKEDVLRLSSFTEEELEYSVNCAFERITSGCEKTNVPTVIYIGGQPGSGKTVLSMQLKNIMKDSVEIGIDNYRMYHPKYLEIEKHIREFWMGKEEGPNNTPGNDIANFTHLFAGMMTDRLAEMCSKVDDKGMAYSIIYEWGMREPSGPLKTMKELNEKGYKNIVIFVATPSVLSYEACKLRADIMKNSKRIIRKVPKEFHDLCVRTLPDSINTIYEEGYNGQIVDYMMIVTRDGNLLWDCNSYEKPGEVYNSILSISDVNNENDLYRAMVSNDREMLGLIDRRKELIDLKESLIIMAPSLFVDSSRSKN